MKSTKSMTPASLAVISPQAKAVAAYHNRLVRGGLREGFAVIYDRTAMWRSKAGRFGVSVPVSVDGKALTRKAAQAALDSGEWGNVAEMFSRRLKQEGVSSSVSQ